MNWNWMTSPFMHATQGSWNMPESDANRVISGRGSWWDHQLWSQGNCRVGTMIVPLILLSSIFLKYKKPRHSIHVMWIWADFSDFMCQILTLSSPQFLSPLLILAAPVVNSPYETQKQNSDTTLDFLPFPLLEWWNMGQPRNVRD